MEKRTLFAVVLMAVLGIGAFAVMRSPDKGERKEPPPRPIPVLKGADVTKLEITTQKDEKVTLEKKGDKWRVTSPSDWPADPTATKVLTEAIGKLTFGDVVTENASKHKDLGVADAGSVHLKITAGPTVDLIVGQTVGGFTMVRLAGKNDVWQANNLFPYQANKSAKDWRDHAFLDVMAAQVDKLTVEVPGGSKLALEQQPGPDGKPAWRVVESTGDAPRAGEPLDQSQPGTVASALQGVRATDFPEGKSAKDAGLDPPSLRITAGQKGKDETLEIGAPQGDEVFVRKAGEPTLYLVKRYLLDRATYRPVDYRDKTLLRYKADEIARLTIAQGKELTALAYKDGKWQLAAGAVDEAKAKVLVGGVENLFGSSVVTDKTVKTELDKPRAIVTVEPKSGAKAVVRIGGLTKDQGDYYATREGGKDVVTVKKFAIDRLLKKPAELAPSAAPPKGPPGMMPPGMMPPGMMPHGGAHP